MRDKVIYFLMAGVLLVTAYGIWNEDIRDVDEIYHQEAFFDDVRSFMDRGGRNTSEHGKKECKRLNIISIVIGRDDLVRDCESFYK